MKELGINLLRSQSILSQTEQVLLEKLKLVAVILLIALLVVGTVAGGFFAVATIRLNALSSEREVTVRRISLQAEKEVLLRTLKDRISALEKTVASQYPWKAILDAVNQIVQPPTLETLSIDNQNTLSLGLSLNSLAELQTITESVEELAQAKKIRQPVIQSLNQTEGENIKVSIRFIPNF